MVEEQQRWVDERESPETDSEENSLRPQLLKDYIGQAKLKQELAVYIHAAQQRDEVLDHVLLFGPPGLGKTTLAHIIAHECQVNIKTTSGPAIEKSGDLLALLSELQAGDVLFIDEIHRLSRSLEEILYSAMEDFYVDIMVGQGPTARSIHYTLPPFTLIGATTKAGALSAPLRDRFGIVANLRYYEPEELQAIIHRSAQVLKLVVTTEAAQAIALRSRGTPRIANRLLKRVRDFAQVQHQEQVNLELAQATLTQLGVDEAGLDDTDRQLLRMMVDLYHGGPVGLKTLAANLGEDIETLETVYEPYLLQQGFLKRTSRGRALTALAYQHLNLAPPSTLKGE